MKKLLLIIIILGLASCAKPEDSQQKLASCNCDKVEETFISGDLISSYTYPNVTNDCNRNGEVTHGSYIANNIYYTTTSTIHCKLNQ